MIVHWLPVTGGLCDPPSPLLPQETMDIRNSKYTITKNLFMKTPCFSRKNERGDEKQITQGRGKSNGKKGQD